MVHVCGDSTRFNWSHILQGYFKGFGTTATTATSTKRRNKSSFTLREARLGVYIETCVDSMIIQSAIASSSLLTSHVMTYICAWNHRVPYPLFSLQNSIRTTLSRGNRHFFIYKLLRFVMGIASSIGFPITITLCHSIIYQKYQFHS